MYKCIKTPKDNYSRWQTSAAIVTLDLGLEQGLKSLDWFYNMYTPPISVKDKKDNYIVQDWGIIAHPDYIHQNIYKTLVRISRNTSLKSLIN